VRAENICHYTGFSSLFSSLQCISSHPNRRQPGHSLKTETPVVCSIVHLDHLTMQEFPTQAESIIYFTETGENWFFVMEICSNNAGYSSDLRNLP
jgi:hypothetical protein